MKSISLVFVRYESGNITTIGIVNLKTTKSVTVKTAKQKLINAVTGWVKNTKSGKDCWITSCKDLNIADLALEDKTFKKQGDPYLKAEGILDFNVEIIDSSEALNFDTVLLTKDFISKDNEE